MSERPLSSLGALHIPEEITVEDHRLMDRLYSMIIDGKYCGTCSRFTMSFELSQELNYDLAIISKDDKIIPTKNQLNFWQNKTKIKEINSTHCPFEIYNSWQDLLC